MYRQNTICIYGKNVNFRLVKISELLQNSAIRAHKSSGDRQTPELYDTYVSVVSEIQVFGKGIVVLDPVVDVHDTVVRGGISDYDLLYARIDDQLAAHHAG